MLQIVVTLLIAFLGSAVVAQRPVSVRLVGPVGPTGAEGVVEVTMTDGSVGRICDAGFDNNGASVVCAMLGYRGVIGYKINLAPVTTGSTNFVMAVSGGCPDFLPGSVSTWTLDAACRYVVPPSLPSSCTGRGNDVAVICTGTRTTAAAGTVATPNLATLPPTTCTGSVNNLRLEPGPTEGIVLIRNATGTNFGSICAADFGVNEATTICRMLCQNATTSAIGLTGMYLNVSSSYPVILSGLTCPAAATSTNDCTHNGWGVVSSTCSSSRAVTVRCTPISLVPPLIPSPTMVCHDYSAFVYFQVSEVPLSSLLSLYGTYNNATCNFTVGQNGTTVWAIMPYIGCNSVQSTNATHVIYTSILYKNVVPVGGVYFDTPYTIPIVCAIPKQGAVSAALSPDARTAPPIVGGDTYTSEVRLFQDYMAGNFLSEITPGSKLIVGSKIYARVQVTSPLNVRLTVRSCWATNTVDGSSTPYYIVKDKCTSSTSSLFRVDTKTIGINFQVMSFTAIPVSTAIYVFCNVTICSAADSADTCSQVCGSSLVRRRRDLSSAMQLSEGSVLTYNGPFQMAEPSAADLAAAAARLTPASAPAPVLTSAGTSARAATAGLLASALSAYRMLTLLL